jgi:hypothetical protein
MKSLQFIVPKQIIKYTKATRNKNVLTIKGEELLKVTEVLLNNYTCDVWVKISDNTLLIEIPEFLHTQSITSIALFGKASNLSTATLSVFKNILLIYEYICIYKHLCNIFGALHTLIYPILVIIRYKIGTLSIFLDEENKRQ